MPNNSVKALKVTQSTDSNEEKSPTSVMLSWCTNVLLRQGMGDGGGGHWLVRMEWHAAGWLVCLPLLIVPCTIKSRILFGHRLTRVVPEKGPWNSCVCVCMCVSVREGILHTTHTIYTFILCQPSDTCMLTQNARVNYKRVYLNCFQPFFLVHETDCLLTLIGKIISLRFIN